LLGAVVHPRDFAPFFRGFLLCLLAAGARHDRTAVFIAIFVQTCAQSLCSVALSFTRLRHSSALARGLLLRLILS
jgi:hypothetical protein